MDGLTEESGVGTVGAAVEFIVEVIAACFLGESREKLEQMRVVRPSITKVEKGSEWIVSGSGKMTIVRDGRGRHQMEFLGVSTKCMKLSFNAGVLFSDLGTTLLNLHNYLPIRGFAIKYLNEHYFM